MRLYQTPKQKNIENMGVTTMKSTVLFLAIITLLAGAWYFMRPTPKRIQTSGENAQKSSDDAMVAVKVPASFSEQELIGKRAFEAVWVVSD